MNFKKIVKNIFINVVKFFKDGIQLYLDYCEISYQLDLHYLYKIL